MLINLEKKGEKTLGKLPRLPSGAHESMRIKCSSHDSQTTSNHNNVFR